MKIQNRNFTEFAPSVNENMGLIAEMTVIQENVNYCRTNLVNKEVHIINGSLPVLTCIVSSNRDKILVVNIRNVIKLHGHINLFLTKAQVDNLGNEK